MLATHLRDLSSDSHSSRPRCLDFLTAGASGYALRLRQNLPPHNPIAVVLGKLSRTARATLLATICCPRIPSDSRLADNPAAKKSVVILWTGAASMTSV
jgi:hypothetical protein